MVYHKALAAAAAALLLSPTALAAGMYTKSSPVLQVDAKNYDKLIAKSNYTSIVEFYAPWCGHCQNLKPAYEKAAKNLAGLAKVAAVNCDEDSNKQLCGQMGVQGFPTLKIVRPGKKPGRPMVEDYQGQRSAKAIVDAVVDKIPNHVKRVADKDLDDFLEENNDAPKAILFTEKGTTSALLRSLAIDFLGSIQVAQIRNKEKKAVEKYNIEKFPTLILLPGGDKEAIVFDGEMKKDAMIEFLSQVAAPNPDPAPGKAKSDKKAKGKEDDKKAADFSAASASHESADAASAKTSAASQTIENKNDPTGSPDPNVVAEDSSKPIEIKQEGPHIRMLDEQAELEKACLTPKSHNCILALLPSRTDATEPLPQDAQDALASLAEVLKKHSKGGHRLFPIFTVPINNAGSLALRGELGLKDKDVELIVTNAKKGWWKHYTGSDFTLKNVEDWIDGVKMGEGKKEKLPESVIVEAKEEPKDEQQPIKIEVEEIPEEKKDTPEHGEL